MQLSDQGLDVLALAVVAPDVFHELGKGTSTVTFNLYQKSPGPSDHYQPVFFVKEKESVLVGFISTDTNILPTQ